MSTVRQNLHKASAPPKAVWIVLLVLALLCPVSGNAAADPLLVFAGAASRPPTEEAAREFRNKSGVQVASTFGGSGFVLSQMRLARKGDLYFPGSSDFMEKAKRDGLVFPETEKVIAYLVPAINVQKGNPRNIRSLKDLLKPGLRIAIADPESVCVGTYAVELVEKNFSRREREIFRKNLATSVESCERTANIISLKGVDAVLGWSVFSSWDSGRIETVLLKPEEIPRIGYIPIAVSRFSRNRVEAEKFIQFLVSPEGKTIFRKHGYLMTPEDARALTLPSTPIGGEYTLPQEWTRGKKNVGR